VVLVGFVLLVLYVSFWMGLLLSAMFGGAWFLQSSDERAGR
jgi:hypothetical protein